MSEKDFWACLSKSLLKGKLGNWFSLNPVNTSSHTDW